MFEVQCEDITSYLCSFILTVCFLCYDVTEHLVMVICISGERPGSAAHHLILLDLTVEGDFGSLGSVQH